MGKESITAFNQSSRLNRPVGAGGGVTDKRIYLAFQTVASTWASKVQGKFIDSGSKKRASDIPLLQFFDFAMTQQQEPETGAVK